MQHRWIIQQGGREVILFFGGWGLDSHAVSHMSGRRDVLMFYDYREMEMKRPVVIDDYDKVYLVGWSMGVWAASLMRSRWSLRTTCAVAINGTERPVDEEYGIAPRVYLLTERGMNEAGRDKFFARMFTEGEERLRFERNRPERPLQEQVEELTAIRVCAADFCPETPWDKAYISQEDKIFPGKNQENWWNRQKVNIVYSNSGHFPFYAMADWDLMVAYGDK